MSGLVETPEDTFCRVVAHIISFLTHGMTNTASPHIISLQFSVDCLFVPTTKSQTMVKLSNNQICIAVKSL